MHQTTLKRRPRRLRNEYLSSIHTQKRTHWRNWLENMDMQSIWKAHKYTKDTGEDGISSRLPSLVGPTVLAETNEEKCQFLMKTFSPTPPEAILDDIENFEYPEPVADEPITPKEVSTAIESL